MSEFKKTTKKAVIQTAKKNNAIQKKKVAFSKPANNISLLQRSIGNQAVQRLMESGVIQAKLTIGQPNDKYEQEADSVADKIMRMPEPNIQTKLMGEQFTPLIQRQPKELLQTKSTGETPQVTSNLESKINALEGGGEPLSKETKGFFEPRFGQDFSKVRVHNDSNAHHLARSINARAFTRGNNVVFGGGEYSPNSSNGKRLLGHELVHTIQQKGILRKKGKVKKNYIITRDRGNSIKRYESISYIKDSSGQILPIGEATLDKNASPKERQDYALAHGYTNPNPSNDKYDSKNNLWILGKDCKKILEKPNQKNSNSWYKAILEKNIITEYSKSEYKVVIAGLGELFTYTSASIKVVSLLENKSIDALNNYIIEIKKINENTKKLININKNAIKALESTKSIATNKKNKHIVKKIIKEINRLEAKINNLNSTIREVEKVPRNSIIGLYKPIGKFGLISAIPTTLNMIENINKRAQLYTDKKINLTTYILGVTYDITVNTISIAIPFFDTIIGFLIDIAKKGGKTESIPNFVESKSNNGTLTSPGDYEFKKTLTKQKLFY